MTEVDEAVRPTSIIATVEANPVMVLTDREKYSAFYRAMKAECDAHVPDLSTETSRKKIASLAHKVARTKTAIDEAGKKLNEEARSRINAIDESRREIRAQLDALKAEVRKPLTEWEEAEEARVKAAHAELTKLREAGRVDFEDTAETVAARLAELSSLKLDPAIHGETLGIAEAARADAMRALGDARDRLVREEAERAELERLRAEAVEREQQEQAKREAEEVERRRAEAEKAETERKAQADAEQKAREEAAAKAAEERARIEAENRAREEREAADRAHAEELAAERRRAEEAERAIQAERERAAREEEDRKAAIAREANAQAAREADRAHRGEVMAAAKEAIMEAGPVDEAAAKAIVLAIAAGSVPAITIRF